MMNRQINFQIGCIIIITSRSNIDGSGCWSEIRDRAIIELVKMSISKGMELTYGDICLMIDSDPSEKEYEKWINY